jgi:DNA-binding HxlR family transcriptional regulator
MTTTSDLPDRLLLTVLSRKWAVLAIKVLDAGPKRFGEVQSILGGVSPKVLTKTLRHLEELGFVSRTVRAQIPLCVEYELTEFGREAAVPIGRLYVWAEENRDRMARTNADFRDRPDS